MKSMVFEVTVVEAESEIPPNITSKDIEETLRTLCGQHVDVFVELVSEE